MTSNGRAFLVQDRIWPAVAYEPHGGQKELHSAGARHRLASCGRRWGKSTAGGHELTPMALYGYTEKDRLQEEGQQTRIWIVGPNYDDAEREWRVFYNDVKKLRLPVERPGTYNDARGGNMMLTLWGGTFIVECRSAQHPESLDGEGLNHALLVEAAKMKPSIWNKFIRPALADKRGSSLHTSTPEGRNHFYELWARGQDPAETEWWSARMPSWTNDIIFPGGRDDPEILEMRKDMSDSRFRQEIGAEFTEFVGRVFKEFDEEVHVKTLQYNPKWPVYLATDYGFTNPFVALVIQVDRWDNVYVLREYRRQYMDVNDIGRELQSWNGGIATRAQKLYPDPAEPGDTALLEKLLRVRAAAGGEVGGTLKWRLELIRQHLKLLPEHVPWEEREPRLFVDRSCVDLISEMADKYRYPDTQSEVRDSPENPLSKDDHGPEALGRFFRGYFGGPAENGSRATVRKANVSSGGTRRRKAGRR